MKLILPLFLFLASCGPSRNIQTRCPKEVTIISPVGGWKTIAIDSIKPDSNLLAYVKSGNEIWVADYHKVGGKPDTVPEWMHVSMRDVGFVVARKALSVRVDGYCTAHLDCAGKPFPEHYHIGWCEGKELLLNRLVKGRVR